MKVFVVGGTGQVGSLVAAGLVLKGATVRVLTRNASRTMPAGQEAVAGDLLAVDVLRAEMARADSVFLMFPPMEALCFAGLTALAVAREVMPRHVVMMTGQDCAIHAAAGHIGGLVVPEMVLAASGLSHTILNPNYFFQNDERQKDMLLGRGVYATPIGDIGLSRCDVRDIAAAALASFERIGKRERILVCGPDILNGEDVAASWSRALGKPIVYGGHQDMAAVESAIRKSGAPPHWALDIRLMYESFQRYGLVASPHDQERLANLIGHAPRRFEDYAVEVARLWSE